MPLRVFFIEGAQLLYVYVVHSVFYCYFCTANIKCL